MSSLLALLKKIYEQKEKIILGILVVAFAGVAYIQLKKNDDPDNPRSESASVIDFTPATPRPKEKFEIPSVSNEYPLETYYEIVRKKNIFRPPGRTGVGGDSEAPEWPQIKVKSVFDPTQSGSYIAIIDVDKRSRIVKEGQAFDSYEVRRIDGVRSCLTIYRRDIDQEKEFCKEE
ncbi:MAG: hypothetical protein Kow0099_22400 [Candidatus Abyssubacteria bacterium]